MRALVCLLGSIGLTAVLSLPARGVTVHGSVTYEKVPATARGLDFDNIVEVPAAQIQVEVRTPNLKTELAQGATDDRGAFHLDVPDGTKKVVLWVASASGKIEVRDPADEMPYTVSGDEFDPAEPQHLVIYDEYDEGERVSGAFNILEMLRRANRLMAQIEPGRPLADLPLVIYWSPDVNAGTDFRGSTFYFNGQRDTNSDEFDDSVILSTYGEYLLNRLAPVVYPRGTYRFSDR